MAPHSLPAGDVLHLIASEAPELIAALDTHLCFIAINRAYADAFAAFFGGRLETGIRLDEALAHEPAELAVARSLWERALAGEEFTTDRQLGTSTDTQRLFELTYRPLRTPDGVMFGASVVGRDVSARRAAELALKNRNEELSQSQRIAGIGTWKWTVATGEVLWSGQSYRIMGYDPDAPPPGLEEQARLFDVDSYKRLMAAIGKARDDGEPFEVDLLVQRPQGTARHVTLRGEALRDNQGRVSTLRGTLQDISERFRAESALEVSEERWRFAVECTGDAIWDWNIADSRTFTSPQWKLMLGFDLDDSVEMDFEGWRSRIHTDDEPGVMRLLLEHLAGQTDSYQAEYRLRAKDGSARWILDRGRVTQRDASGRPMRMLGIHSDVTPRHKSEAALADSRREYQLLIESQSELVFRWLPDTTLTFVNQSCIRHLGRMGDDLIGKRLVDIVPVDERYAVELTVERIKAERGPSGYEHASVGSDGGLVWHLWKTTPIRDNRGDVREFLSVGLDITERKRAEEALRASEAKFAAFMDNCPAAAWTTDQSGLITYANKTYGLVFTGGDPTGRNVRDVYPPHLVEEYLAYNREVLLGNAPMKRTKPGLRANGSPGQFLVYKFPTQDYDGRTVIGNMAIDVTDGELAAGALRLQMAVLDVVANSLSRLINATAEQADEVLASALASLGASMNVDRAWLFRVFPEKGMLSNTFEWCAEGIKPEIDTMQAIPIDSVPWVYDQLVRENVLAINDLDELPAEAKDFRSLLEAQSIQSVLVIPITTSRGLHEFIGFDSVKQRRSWQDGEVRALESIASGVSQVINREHAEAALQASEERYRLVLRATNDAVWDWDIVTGELFWSDNVKTMLGIPADQMGDNMAGWASRLHPEEAQRVHRKLDEALASDSAFWSDEYHFRRTDGVYALIFDRAYILRDAAGKALRMIGAATDITTSRQLSEKLRESVQLLSELPEQVPGVIYQFMRRVDGSYCFPYASSGIVSIYELTPEEVREDAILAVERIHPEDTPRIIDSIEWSAQALTPWSEDYRVVLPRQGIRWLRGISRPTRLSDGSVLWHGYINDITDMKVQEEALRAKSEELDRYFEYSLDLLCIADMQGRFLRLNPEWERTLGYALEELVQKPFMEFVHEDDLPATMRVMMLLEENEEVPALRNRYRHKDGTYRWFEWRAVPKDEQIFALARDVTHQMSVETALRENEARLRESQRVASVGSWEWNPATDTVVWSEEMYRVVGRDPGMPPISWACHENLYTAESFARLKVAVERALKTSSPYELELELRRPGGSLHWMMARGEPVLNASGKLVMLRGTLQDIDARKRAEIEREHLQMQLVQAQKMESVGRLAGGVAHDFNNMLTVILGHAAMALNQVPVEMPLYADLVEIRDAAQRSADLTRQLLAFARKQRTLPQVLDINETISGMLRMLRRLIGEGIELNWRPASDLWCVCMDPSQMDQILANLLANARDVMEGSGKVFIETRNVVIGEAEATPPDGQPGAYVRLSVTDTGAGMDEETMSHLFEPFFTTKEIGKGTGLGLATVYGTVRQIGGFITVRSAPGMGTTFNLHLPRVLDRPAPSDPSEPAHPTRGTETILIAEDEPGILQLTTRILSRAGYQVLAADGPSAALRLAQSHTTTIHLLITDVVMPEMSGSQLKKLLMVMRPGLKTIYVSGYSANAISADEASAPDFCFIQKPFTVDSLCAAVRGVLDAKS